MKHGKKLSGKKAKKALAKWMADNKRLGLEHLNEAYWKATKEKS